eukprot:scaffold44866_cov168-Amphora_coffeaeformis.AAC.1
MTDLVANGLFFGQGPRTIGLSLQKACTKLCAHKLDNGTIDFHFLLLGTSGFQVITGMIVEGRALAATEHVKFGRRFNEFILIIIQQPCGNVNHRRFLWLFSDAAHDDSFGCCVSKYFVRWVGSQRRDVSFL